MLFSHESRRTLYVSWGHVIRGSSFDNCNYRQSIDI
jgi:hypothetical protein